MTKLLTNAQGKVLLANNKAFLSPGEKYGCGIDNLLGDVDSSGVLQLPSEQVNGLTFTGVKDISYRGLYYKFASCQNITGLVSFPDLEQITGANAIYFAFENSGITGVSCPKLTAVSNAQGYAFQGCTNLTSVSFPLLANISSGYACNSWFGSCTSLTTIEFPELLGFAQYTYDGFYNIFNDCTSLTTVRFPKLTNLDANKCMEQAFNGCTSLENVYFNGLTTSSFGSSFKTQFTNLMRNTGDSTTHTLHFPSNLQSTIATLSGYPLFGGTDGYVTLAFDLTATS